MDLHCHNFREAVYWTFALPLTLTLSPGEREKPLSAHFIIDGSSTQFRYTYFARKNGDRHE